MRIFFTGVLISFLGSLPLGTLNIAAMQIGITDGWVPAIQFSMGLLLVEMIYVRVSLVAMDKVRKHERLMKSLEWVALLVVVALSIFSFVAAANANANAQNVVLSNGLPRFVLGMLMSALNPVQIPFWFGWSTVLFSRKILLPKNAHYNIYIAGIGIGTFAGSSLFIIGGKLLVDILNTNQQAINIAIGSIFAFTALIQLWKIFRKKKVVEIAE